MSLSIKAFSTQFGELQEAQNYQTHGGYGGSSETEHVQLTLLAWVYRLYRCLVWVEQFQE